MSQLAALLRTHQFMRFGPDDSSVTLAPKPLFLAKTKEGATEWHQSWYQRG